MIMSDNYLVSENAFEPVLDIIEHAKNRAIRAANAEMIQMYWDIGKYVSDSVEDGGWGKASWKIFPISFAGTIRLPKDSPLKTSGE